jgi:hypothetical protein
MVIDILSQMGTHVATYTPLAGGISAQAAPGLGPGEMFANPGGAFVPRQYFTAGDSLTILSTIVSVAWESGSAQFGTTGAPPLTAPPAFRIGYRQRGDVPGTVRLFNSLPSPGFNVPALNYEMSLGAFVDASDLFLPTADFTLIATWIAPPWINTIGYPAALVGVPQAVIVSAKVIHNFALVP